jgi:threonine/homoserine/homoserine lactone efflux protein
MPSQTLSDGTTAGLRSTAGVCLGYVGHSILVALGVAAIIAASPALFEALRWFGVAYLIYRVEDWRAGRPRYLDRSTSPAPSTSHATSLPARKVRRADGARLLCLLSPAGSSSGAAF